MSSVLRRNVIANFIGQFWNALLRLAFVPIYFHLLGAEAYGLVGFFTAIEAISMVLDMSLSTTATREIARRLDDPEGAGECRSLIRTLEVIYWAAGLLIGLALLLAIGPIMTSWLEVRILSPDTVKRSLIILALMMIFRISLPFYRGILIGLQRQVLLNAAGMVVAAIRNGGTLVVLLYLSPTIVAFLSWQLAIHIVEIMTFRLMAWTRLPPPPPGERAAFRLALLRPLRGFALSMGCIALSSMVLTQLDKILISRFLPLDRLGYYTVAATMANGLVLIASPFFTAVFPHFSSASRSHETKSLAHTYHQASKWVSLISAPAAGILIFFSYEVLWVWTRSEELATAASAALSLLALGYLFNVIVAVPYALQLATGLTWIPLCLNLISVVAAVPLTVACIKLWGISGAAAGILTLTTFTVLAMPHLMHRQVLKGEKRSWYLSDTLPFIAASMIIFYLMKSLSSHLGFGKAGLAFAAAGLLVYGLVIWTKFRREMAHFGDAVNIGE